MYRSGLWGSRIDNIDNLNNYNNNKVEATLESLSKNIILNKEDVLYLTTFQSIMRFLKKDKPIIEIATEKPNDYSIKQFYGASKTYLSRWSKLTFK